MTKVYDDDPPPRIKVRPTKPIKTGRYDGRPPKKDRGKDLAKAGIILGIGAAIAIGKYKGGGGRHNGGSMGGMGGMKRH